MNWRVAWTTTAEDGLASLGLDAVDRNLLARAAAAIDRQLQQDPEGVGESRPNGQRIAFEAPLAIRYCVFHQDQLVKVLRVWQF